MNATAGNKPYKAAFSSVSIIFNPISTGDGKTMASDLKAELLKQLPGQKIALIPTRHPNHAEELAYKLSKAGERPLIISASGDGGYNEVVNGLIRANNEGANAVAGLLPAGNANDHYHDAHRGDIVRAIGRGRTNMIDLLQLDSTVGGRPFTRLAHSYIGFGLTPKVGQELNKVDLNRFNQIWIVAKGLLALQPVKIMLNGKRFSCHSLVCSNVHTMSKVLKLSAEASNTDGKFEITVFRRHHKLSLLASLVKASTVGLSDAQSVKEFRFKSLKRILVQLDGEIARIDARSDVKIKIISKALECIV